MAPDSESQSSSQYLSSSYSSLNSSKKASPDFSKIYKHASQLYLTRRLAEAYETLQPVITPPRQTNSHIDEEVTPLAPIATATTSQRIKIWSLYITLLNAIVDLGAEEGRRDFGQKEYRTIRDAVRDGELWEQVVRDGYRDREGSVDAEVVYNLSTVLLGQAPNQKLNQSRLETYLSSSSQPDLDISNHLSRSTSSRSRPNINGTSTPKDLNSRLKILELFTLHVLPRNEEWEYARSFIANSDVLDDERREAFLQTLQELQDVREQGDYQEEDVFEEAEELQNENDEVTQKDAEEAVADCGTTKPHDISHKRKSSEVDYGIEKSHPNGTSVSNGHTALGTAPDPGVEKTLKTSPQSPPASLNRGSHLSPPSQTPRNRPIRKSTHAKSNDLFSQARNLILALQHLVQNMAGAVTKNPGVLFRALLFMLAFFMAFSRQAVRDRARKIMSQGWTKVKGTVGMGVKVSYI